VELEATESASGRLIRSRYAAVLGVGFRRMLPATTFWTMSDLLLQSLFRDLQLISWANEAHDLATSSVYGELQHAGALPDSYEAQALPIVNEQLERAGVRLAKVLNNCLR
jgi:S1/P1 Nuclease